MCYIYGFLLDIEGSYKTREDKKKTWYLFLIEKEHLFIKNIYIVVKRFPEWIT